MKHRGAPFRVFKIPGFQGSQHIPTYPNILHKGIQSGQTLTFPVAHVAHTSQQGMVDAQPRSMGTGRHRETPGAGEKLCPRSIGKVLQLIWDPWKWIGN